MSNKHADFYCQCTLKLKNSETYTVSWIPAQFAKPGKELDLKRSSTELWETWIVQTASEPRAADLVEERENDHRNWRKVTDI